MRIALAVEGTRGDVYPMLALGSAFLARGHEVLICATPDFESEVRAHDLEFVPVGHNVHEFLAGQAAAVARGGRAALREATRWLRGSIESQLRALPSATQGADLILGAGLQIGARSAAELHGVPYRYVMYCPGLLPSADHPPMMLPVPSLPRWINWLGWWLAIACLDRWFRSAINRERARLGLCSVGSVYHHLASDRPVLAADPELAPLPADCPIPVDRIGCLHPTEGTPLPAKLESFLEAGPPPVYLGFGSMTDPDPRATTGSILEAIERSGCRAILSRGWSGLGDGALPEGVFATGSVSHAALFPRVAAVVHHGGAGTTTTAARAGVPQIVVPHMADQFYWAQQVARLGLGPRAIPRRRFGAESLLATLSTTLDNEFLIERASALAARLRTHSLRDSDPTTLFLEGQDPRG